MKIRRQFTLLELTLIATMFLSLILSIVAFTNFVGVEDLKTKSATLQGTGTLLRYSVISLFSSAKSSDHILFDYTFNIQQLSSELEAIEEDRFFKKLPDETKDFFSNIKRTWLEEVIILSPEQILQFLELRLQKFEIQADSSNFSYPVLQEFQGDVGEQEEYYGRSLSLLYSLLQDDSQVPAEYFSSVENALQELQQLDRRLQTFELFLQTGSSYMLDASARYRQLQLIFAIIIPFIAALLSVLGILFFATVFSQKITLLEKVLKEIASGDFAVRVETRGNDEFSSLSESINTLNKVLRANWESFQLVTEHMGHSLEEGLDSSQIEQTFVQLATENTLAEGAAFFKVGGESEELYLSAITGQFFPPFSLNSEQRKLADRNKEDFLRSYRIPLGHTIVGKVASQGTPILIRDVSRSKEIDWGRSSDDPFFIGSFIALPLRVSSKIFGVLAVTTSQEKKPFSDLEFTNLQSFAEFAAITLENLYIYTDMLEAAQLDRELDIADEIQRDLMPQEIAQIPHTEISCFSRRIKGLNSDYFDVKPLSKEKIMLSVCEVAGKGISAGLVMIILRTLLHLIAREDSDAQTLMNTLNKNLARHKGIENYARVSILIVDSTGEFSFSSAAHHPLQVLRGSSGVFQSFAVKGIPVGVDPDASYNQALGNLEKNDIIFLHSEGIPETMNSQNEMLGLESVLDLISRYGDESPEKIIGYLRNDLDHFEQRSKQQDDKTAIVLKYKGSNNK